MEARRSNARIPRVKIAHNVPRPKTHQPLENVVTIGEKWSVQTTPEQVFMVLELKRTHGVQLGKTDFDELQMRISEDLAINPLSTTKVQKSALGVQPDYYREAANCRAGVRRPRSPIPDAIPALR